MSSERVGSLSKRASNMCHKIPYVDIISDAIIESPHRRLTAKEIFDHISVKYGPMKSAETLKNTIRHTLSRYKIFRKIQRGKQKKPNWWTVDEDGGNRNNQIEDLQQDVKVAKRSPPTRAIMRSLPESRNQQRLELAAESQDYSTPSDNLALPPIQQLPRLFNNAAPPHRGGVIVGDFGDIYRSGRADDVATSGDMGDGFRGGYQSGAYFNDPMAAGPSHSAYGYPVAGETTSYAFPYQEPPPQTDTVTIAPDNSQNLSAPTPFPEYYQM